MASDYRKYLFDIVRAGAAIREFCRDRTFAEYESSWLLRSACERQLEILGEVSLACVTGILRSTRISLRAAE